MDTSPNAKPDAPLEARCAARGDTMKPHVHLNPERTTTYMADKSSVGLLFAITAAHNLHLKQIDIEAAYLHEDFDHIGKSLSLYASTPVLTARSSMTAREENS